MLTRTRGRKGTSLIEMSAAILIALPVLLFFCDMTLLAIGLQINEKTCLDAARTAASGAPESAELRAASVVERMNSEKAEIITNIRLVDVLNDIDPKSLKFVKQYGGTVPGRVNITTCIDVKPIFFRCLAPNGQYFTLQAKESFPYTYVIPSAQVK